MIMMIVMTIAAMCAMSTAVGDKEEDIRTEVKQLVSTQCDVASVYPCRLHSALKPVLHRGDNPFAISQQHRQRAGMGMVKAESHLTRLKEDSAVNLDITSIAHRLNACPCAVCEHGAWYQCCRLADLVEGPEAEPHRGCCCWLFLALGAAATTLLVVSSFCRASLSTPCVSLLVVCCDMVRMRAVLVVRTRACARRISTVAE